MSTNDLAHTGHSHAPGLPPAQAPAVPKQFVKGARNDVSRGTPNDHLPNKVEIDTASLSHSGTFSLSPCGRFVVLNSYVSGKTVLVDVSKSQTYVEHDPSPVNGLKLL